MSGEPAADTNHLATPAGRLTWLGFGLLVAGVALLGLVCAYGVHDSCYDPGPPVARPTAGTARDIYCVGVETIGLWPLLVTAPIVLVVGGILALGRRTRPSLWCAAAVSVLAVVHLIVVGSLAYNYTV
jgi:hypothetical protein